MDIFDKAIKRIGKIISDSQKAFKAIDREEIPPYLDCDNEKELLDSYGRACITRTQFEEGCKYFAEANESIAYKGRDYKLVLKALRGTITTLTEYMEDDREDRKWKRN